MSTVWREEQVDLKVKTDRFFRVKALVIRGTQSERVEVSRSKQALEGRAQDLVVSVEDHKERSLEAKCQKTV